MELEEKLSEFRRACDLITNVYCAGRNPKNVSNYGMRTFRYEDGSFWERFVIVFRNGEEIHIMYYNDEAANGCVVKYVSPDGTEYPDHIHTFSEPVSEFELPLTMGGLRGWVAELQDIIVYFIEYHALHNGLGGISRILKSE